MCFSASDDTLAPPGQHVVTIWGQWYPYALADGADWDALAESEAARLVAAVDRYAPGFADSVQRLYVQTPLAAGAGTVAAPWQRHARGDGAGQHVRVPADARRCPATRVPGLPGLYLAGASTHPGGGVSGNSGRTAARVVLADRRPLGPRPRRPCAALPPEAAVTAAVRVRGAPPPAAARALPLALAGAAGAHRDRLSADLRRRAATR